MGRPIKHKKRATSHDVALLAGVSQSAVSRCFKPGASVSKKMRDRVMSAAKKMNYQPNAIARSLITQRTNMVAILVSPSINFYYPEVLFELTYKLNAHNLRSLLFTIENENDVENALDQIWQYQLDGLISASFLTQAQHEILDSRNIPIVMFNRFFEEYPSNTVWCDISKAAQELVTHLVEAAHKKFAILQGPDSSMVNRSRLQALTIALAKHKLKPQKIVQGNFLHDSAVPAVQKLMEADPPPTAILCTNDMMAMGALDELRNVMGLTVPHDISVTGMDGIGAARFASYELTTIRQPIGRMADAAVSMLLERIERKNISPERRVFEGTYIKGTSTGRKSL
ncbi:MAG: LacI family DNA-binding transcriptional regulator [Alphaproteobacteria bacterium]|nr:LacI family DNA-binding transcriptional regulator [Alphaproteobacteria bacterium]